MNQAWFNASDLNIVPQLLGKNVSMTTVPFHMKLMMKSKDSWAACWYSVSFVYSYK